MTRTRGDLFARISLDYADHPKIAALSDGAFRAHVEMILWSRKYLTDGRIPKRFANRFGNPAGNPVGSSPLDELLANDDRSPSLIELEDGDYMLHDYADHQEIIPFAQTIRDTQRDEIHMMRNWLAEWF